MGVVARQTLKKSIVLIIGVLIGTLSTLFVYPLNLTFYGNLQFIISAVALLLPLATVGIQSLVVRFFPQFSDSRNDNRGFLGFLFLILSCTLTLFLILSFIGQNVFYSGIESLGWSKSVFENNALPIFGLLICNAFVGVTQTYLTNYQRVVIPSILTSFLIKVLVPSLVLLSVYTLYTDELLKWLYVIIKTLSLGVLVYYTYRLGALHIKVDWTYLNKKKIKEMSEYALFGVLGSLSSVIAFRIDTVMVAGFTDFEKTGIYSIALFIASIMVIPSKSINPLVGAQISDHHSRNEMGKIQILYQKSSLTLVILGLGFFLMIWWNLDDIFQITPRTEELMTGKMVVLYIGIAKLIDMVMGLNSPIIAYSKYFRWNFFFILIMGGLTIITNLYFIPRIGFVGAAVATMISLVIYNLMKFIFIWIVFRIQPFTVHTAYALLISVVCSLVVYFVPMSGLPLVDMVIRSLLIVIFFGLPIYYFKVSDDINRETDRLIKLVRGRL